MKRNQESFEYDILGQRYPLPRIDGESHTKEHILVNATLLFARQGYATVSMRDIAKTIGIKPASLYNHFISKEALWTEAVEHASELYLLYFNMKVQERLGRAIPYDPPVMFSDLQRFILRAVGKGC